MAASTEANLPIDTSVNLPSSIKNAAALAEAAHKAAYGEAPTAEAAPPPAVQETPEVPPPQTQTQAPPPPPQPIPQPPPEAPAEMGSVEQEHHRYLSMKGRYEQATQTLGSMQEQMSQMGDEIMRLQQAMTAQRQSAPPPPPPQPLLTDKDIEAYGPELLDVVKRAALEAVSPELQRLNQTTQRVNQTMQRQTQQNVYQQLGASVPNWEEINESPRFKQWAGLRDVYSGEVRSKLLNAALRAADAPRVIAFFNGFLNEERATGQAPAPQNEAATPRQAAVSLETLAAPGKAKPASGGTMPGSPADKPIFTRAQISEFYTRVRQGAYSGRDADKARDEGMIFSAQREGRVRG